MQINSLIICRSAQRRSLLQQGMIDQPLFDQVKYSSVIEDFTPKFRSENNIQLIFISPEYTKENIATFIKEASLHSNLRDAAYVMLVDWELDSEGEQNIEMWKSIGFNGFLVAPYTINSLKEIGQQASKVVKEKLLRRKRESINSYLDLLLSQLNLAALNYQTSNPDFNQNVTEFKNLARSLRTLEQTDFNIFYNALINLTTEENSKRRDGSYYGSSQRLKKRYEQMLISKIKKHLLQGNGVDF
jgi:hypothetical protein